MKSKLIVGRLVPVEGGQAVEPLQHGTVVLDHQHKLAALIAAAYVYRDEQTRASLDKLRQAALDL